MQLDSIRNCLKKKSILVQKQRTTTQPSKNTSNISNCIKIKRSSQTKFYMQLNSKKKKHFLLQKIEDYDLTKQKYFECIIYMFTHKIILLYNIIYVILTTIIY